MYYSNGNYEAFARARKPENVDLKEAYLIGAGLASLAAAIFMIRDGQMEGNKIHIFEELDIPGGSLDGIYDNPRGFVIRGGREMENHFECLWDLFRSVPSLEVPDASVLDEFYWLNKYDPNSSKCRATVKQGQNAQTGDKFTLSEKAIKEITRLYLTSEELLQDKTIEEVFTEDFFASNFWLYWRTMFAFESWHSALEMRRYIMRFIHHIGGLPDFTALKFTKYNQYESLVLPMMKYLKERGVEFIYGAQVQNVIVDIDSPSERKVAHKILYTLKGKQKEIALTENDLVFVTNGSITESSSLGDHHTPAPTNDVLGGSWTLWKRIAQQHRDFGNPDKFCGDIPRSNFVSATITTLDNRIPSYVERITGRDPFSGKVTTGGIGTIKDSNWLMSWTFNRTPHFKEQPANELVGWIYGLFSDRKGNYVKKTMRECTGEEITQELLYHMGVPEKEIEDMAARSARTVPCMLPFAMAYFMPRALGDRPLTVPKGSVNLAFIGNFAETERDTVFTTEYSVRTAMEAVYRLLDIDRGVPEVWASAFDIRAILNASYRLMDKKKLKELDLPWIVRLFGRKGLEKIRGTMIYDLLRETGLV